MDIDVVMICWSGDNYPQEWINSAVEAHRERYADEVWAIKPNKEFLWMENTILITNNYMTADEATSYVWKLCGVERVTV